MQKPGTLQFWDDFYRNQNVAAAEGGAKEWIAQPSRALFRFLLERATDASSPPPLEISPPNDPNTHSPECMPRNENTGISEMSQNSSNHCFRILEIGCGTSRLSRELWTFLNDEKNLWVDTTSSSSSHQKWIARSKQSSFFILATDVSPVCIQQNRDRDKDIPFTELAYEVLNLTALELDPRFLNNFDWILDKGCLDTFLFRSKKQHDNLSLLVTTVLDNIYKMLTPVGVYIILSPRSKLKTLREYEGFDVVRHMIKDDAVSRGDLEGDEKARQVIYCYICRRKEQSTGDVVSELCTSELEQTRSDHNSSEMCPSCGITFHSFSNDSRRRGHIKAAQQREWKGHCQHCCSVSK